MKGDSVTIKRRTLVQLRELLKAGDSVTAAKIVDQCLDTFRQDELRRCKRIAYETFKAGKRSYEEYRRLADYADSFLR